MLLCNVIFVTCGMCLQAFAQAVVNDPWYREDTWGSKVGYSQYISEVTGRTPVRAVYVVVIDTGCKPDADIADGENVLDLIGGSITNDHGTQVASLVAAITNNGRGIATFGGPVKVKCIRAADDDGTITPANSTKAMQGAIDLKQKQGLPVVATVSSYSWNGTVTQAQSQIVNALLAADIQPFAATALRASGEPCDVIPACVPGVIRVSPLLADSTPLAGMEWGSIFAPGQNVPALFGDPDDRAVNVSGPSIATPAAAGVYAALIAWHGMSSSEARERLKFGSTLVSGTSTRAINAGLANTWKLLLVGAENSSDIAALDAVNHTAGPFTLTSTYFGIPTTTRVMLFAYNGLQPGEPASAIIASARFIQNGLTQTVPLQIEYAGVLPDQPFLTQINVLVDAQLSGKIGTITLTAHGQTSNELPLTIK